MDISQLLTSPLYTPLYSDDLDMVNGYGQPILRRSTDDSQRSIFFFTTLDSIYHFIEEDGGIVDDVYPFSLVEGDAFITLLQKAYSLGITHVVFDLNEENHITYKLDYFFKQCHIAPTQNNVTTIGTYPIYNYYDPYKLTQTEINHLSNNYNQMSLPELIYSYHKTPDKAILKAIRLALDHIPYYLKLSDYQEPITNNNQLTIYYTNRFIYHERNQYTSFETVEALDDLLKRFAIKEIVVTDGAHDKVILQTSTFLSQDLNKRYQEPSFTLLITDFQDGYYSGYLHGVIKTDNDYTLYTTSSTTIHIDEIVEGQKIVTKANDSYIRIKTNKPISEYCFSILTNMPKSDNPVLSSLAFHTQSMMVKPGFSKALDAAILDAHYYLIDDHKAVLSPKLTQQPYQEINFNKLLEKHSDILINEGMLNSLLLPYDYLAHLKDQTETYLESNSHHKLTQIITYILYALLFLLVIIYMYFSYIK